MKMQVGVLLIFYCVPINVSELHISRYFPKANKLLTFNRHSP